MRRAANQIPTADKALGTLCSNAIRMLAVEAIEKANSGHPGAPMGMADLAFVLWTRYLRHDPSDPTWPDRDRFVLSNGHASGMLYALLHLSGYGLTIEDLKEFRQWGSLTPGHPEHGLTRGVEVTTGPLGQGFSNAVGMALAATRLAAVTAGGPGFSPVNHKIFVMMGDGCMMEGVTQEAASIAGHHGLSNLICIYDDNGITIDGPTSLAFSDNTEARFQALGWNTISCDGHDHEDIARALDLALAEESRPTLILAKTEIGHGSPNKVNTSGVHGSPLGKAELALTREQLGWNLPPFEVPEEVYAWFKSCGEQGARDRKAWEENMKTWRAGNPEAAGLWDRHLLQKEPEAALEDFLAAGALGKPESTRKLSGLVLQKAAALTPWLIGASADLTPSNVTQLKGKGLLGPNRDGTNPGGMYLHGGIREHGLAAVVNGITLHGSHRAFVGTFLVFSDYMRPSLRLAAMMELPSIFLFSHDSFMVGEDGPTHQPIEHTASLRAIPGMTVLRPADGPETAMAWYHSLYKAKTPVSLLLTRQTLDTLPHKEGWDPREVLKGAYILVDTEGTPDLIIVATGSEVSLAVESAGQLAGQGIQARVVSMPSRELFLAQDQAWRTQVLLDRQVPVVTLEAGSTLGWDRIAGDRGLMLGIDHFGASAPAEVLAEKFGFTPNQVTARILEWLPRG